MTSYRLAIVTSHPIQYQAPFFRKIAQHPLIDLTVYFAHDASLKGDFDPDFGVSLTWDKPLLEGYRSVVLNPSAQTFTEGNSKWRAKARVISELRHNRYDGVIIYGYNGKLPLLAYLGAWLSRTPIFQQNDSEAFYPRSIWKTIYRRIVITTLFKGTRFAMGIGNSNREFYRAHGMADSAILQAPYSVDNDFFEAEYRRLLPERDMLRQAYGFSPGMPVIMYCGKIIPGKRPLDLLHAYHRLIEQGDEAGLVFIGDGPLRPEIEAYIRKWRLTNVYITGFRNISEISASYILGDIFVFPSVRDAWGLVINEAMLFRMPAIVTDMAGASYDLIEPGTTGYRIRSGDVDALTQHLAELIRDADKRRRMGAAAHKLVTENYNYAIVVESIVQALSAQSAPTSISGEI